MPLIPHALDARARWKSCVCGLILLIGLALPGVLRSAEPGFQYPLAVASVGDVAYVADRNLPGIWSVSPKETTIAFQASKTFRTPLNAVRCLAVDREGKLIAGDSSTRQVYRLENGIPVPLVTSKAGVGIPMGLGIDRQGDIIVTDLETRRLCRIPAAGGAPDWFAEVVAPRGMAIDDEDRIWVVSHGPNQLVRVGRDGNVETIVSGRPFQFPHSITFDDQKSAYVADGYARTIWKINPGSKPAAWAVGEPLLNPVGICWTKDHMLIADPHAKTLFAADRDGRITRPAPESAVP